MSSLGYKLLPCVMVAILTYLLIYKAQLDITADHPALELVMCDVGQGDALLLIVDNIEVVIDGGPVASSDQLLRCLTDHLPNGDRDIEVVVATHPDADHIGGLPAVLENYAVTAVVASQLQRDTAINKTWLAAVQAEPGLRQLCPEPLEKIQMGPQTDLWILYPSCQRLEALGEAEKEDANHHSIVILLQHGQTTALFTGDLDISGEQALMGEGLITKTQILKIGHHGAKNSTSLGFLTALNPEIALIGVGQQNTYGHPDSSVLNTLAALGVRVKRTDLDRTVRLVSDGQQWQEVPVGQ